MIYRKLEKYTHITVAQFLIYLLRTCAVQYMSCAHDIHVEGININIYFIFEL